MNEDVNVIENPKFTGRYMNDGIRQVDFVLVYATEKEWNFIPHLPNIKKKELSETITETRIRRKYFEYKLQKEGLHLETSEAVHEGVTVTFVKVHVPWEPLCRYADKLRIKSPLWIYDADPVVEESSFLQKLLRFQTKHNEEKQMAFRSTKHINWFFSRIHQNRYAVINEKTYFTPTQRLEIAHEILQKVPCNPKNTKKHGLSNLLEDKVYECAYPLHDCDEKEMHDNESSSSLRKKLHHTWANWSVIHRQQSLLDVRNYFGEKIAFYYAFMEVYTKMLIFPSAVGFLAFVMGMLSTAFNPDIPEICTLGDNGINVTHTKINDADVARLTMCPICQPPRCAPWKMIPDGCFQYTWAYRLDNTYTFALSVFMSLWAIVFLKIWRRREATLAAEWDTEDAEEHDIVIRSQYVEKAQGERRNPITLEMEPFISSQTICLWVCGSVFITVLVLLLACFILAMLVLSRIELYGALRNLLGSNNVECGRWLIHGLLFVAVVVLEWAYNKIALMLTEYECPKTEKQFLNSLLWKVFIFQCLNDFIPIGYAAWLKGKITTTPIRLGLIGELCDGGCMGEVTELVAILLLVRLMVGNMTELGVPLAKHLWATRINDKEKENNPTAGQFVTDYHLEETEFDGVYEDLMEMMIQFMFIVLFIPALPVAAFVCFLNNIVEIRLDAVKMLKTRRRPVPIRTSGIGVWNQFLDIITKCGIICNAGLFAFTSDNIPRWFYSANNSDDGYFGFTKYSLSKVLTKDYNLRLEHNDMLHENISVCYYPDFRHPDPPYALTTQYWQILTVKAGAFGAYCVIFFIIMWLVNAFVSNVPESVKVKINRKNYIVNRGFEVGHAIKGNILSKRLNSAYEADLQ